MSHTISDKEKLIARVRRIKGQIEGIERALAAEAPCGEVLRQVASVRGAMNGLTSELFDDHLREHVLGAASDADREHGAQELMGIVRTYLK